MKKLWASRLATGVAVVLAVAAVLSCGGGGAEGDPSLAGKPFGRRGDGALPSFTGSAVTGLIGIVVDSTSGSPIPGVTITASGLTTVSDANGNFALPTIPNGTSVVSFNIGSFAPQSRTVEITPTIETSVIMLMTPNATPVTLDPAAGGTAAGTVPAQLVAAAGALALSGGGAPASGNANVVLTPLSTALDAYLEPGEYMANGSPFETFGGLDIRITDSAGAAITDVTGPVTIRIPVSTRFAAPPGTATLFRFDPAAGTYVTGATATLGGSAPNQYYEGTINGLGTWVAGQAYSPSTLSVCVENQNGVRIAGARVQSDGQNYSGGGAGVTDSTGVAQVPMKLGANAVVTATSPRSSNSTTVTAPGATFTVTPCLIMPTSGLTIRLTWGSAPSDLDSHLKGPNAMHVYFASRGSLSSQPFSALDVDDVTSFGPEVITVAQLPIGTSEYFVHNFSNNGSITTSPARVEMRFGSQIRIFSPPGGEGANRYWRVFQFVVASDCSVTFNSVQQWASSEPANPAGSATATYCQ
jgi:hypothetical protein